MSQSRPTLFGYKFDYKQQEQAASLENIYDKLLKATKENNLESVSLLIQQGAYTKPTSRDTFKNNNDNPLHIAAQNGNLEMLKILFQAKDADVDVTGGNLSTPLHCAAAKGNINVIQYLISKGADVNAQTCHGFTPLHFTISCKKPDAAKVLIDNDASPYIKSSPLLSTTPLEWAQGIHGTYRGDANYKNEEIADYMVKNYSHKRTMTPSN